MKNLILKFPARRLRAASGQDGAIIGPLVWAVVIVGALGYTMMQGISSYTASSGGDKLRLHASTLQNQGSFFKMAADRLYGYGRIVPTATQISTAGSYPNVMDVSANCTGNTADDATGNDSCFFSPHGGGIAVQIPPANAVPTTTTAWTVFKAPITNLGTTAEELIAALRVRQDVCVEINKSLYNETTPATATSVTFDNTFNPGSSGRTAACVFQSPDYVYYQVLTVE